MADYNVLNGGAETLAGMKNMLLELDENQKRSITLEVDEQKYEKLISGHEKAMNDEISTTIKKRQDEISFSFDEQIDQTRIRLKKVKVKRDKLKSAKVSERIDFETKDLQEEKRKLHQEIKSVFKVSQIPSLFNNKMFYSLHMPGIRSDYLFVAVTVLVLLGLPFLLYKIIVSEPSTFLLILFYVLIIGAFAGVYYLIHKFVYTKHSDSLKVVQSVRTKLEANRKATITVQKSIKKDPDESSYGLEDYDREMDELDAEICNIAERKKEALTVFENETKNAIINEIRFSYSGELNKYRSELEKAHSEKKTSDENVKNLKLEISNKYESYIGKEYVSVAMADQLSDIIKCGEASTVADAIKYYERQLTEAISIQKK